VLLRRHTGADAERSGTDWDEILYNDVPNMDLKGKKVAFFGCGDSMSVYPLGRFQKTCPVIKFAGYGDYFCDAMGELYDKFAESGVETIGTTCRQHVDHADRIAMCKHCSIKQRVVLNRVCISGFFDVDKTPECVASKAIRDGKFVGLACDEDNFYDETDKRIAAWTEQLKSEGAA